MRQHLVKMIVGVAAVLTAATASAAVININFDSLSTGVIDAAAFSDLVFTNTLVETSGFEASAPNGIMSASSPFSWNQANAVGVVFNTTASTASIVGLNVGFNGLRLDAFDAGNNLLASTTVFGTTEGGIAGINPPGETFTLSVFAANIKRLAIYQVTTNFDDTIVLDNFSADVDAAVVPEPASLSLLALGLASAAAGRRLRRQKL